MFNKITIDNWILGGSIFLLIFTLGCYLWFQNEMAHLQYNGEIETETQHLEKSSETEQVETPLIELTDTVQPDTYEKSSADIEDTSPITSNVSSAQQAHIRIVPLALITVIQKK